MKTKTSSCCGGYIQRKPKQVEVIHENPEVPHGVAVIYIGAGNFRVKGTHSGEYYYASDHHRHFNVFKEDAEGVLRNGKVILGGRGR